MMKGKLHIFRARGALTDAPEIRDIEVWPGDQLMLTTLRGILEDDLEPVPHFDTVKLADKIVPCVALCGEHGKLEGKPTNRRATLLWRYALHRHEDPMISAAVWLSHDDVLAGTVVVLTGDPEFLTSL